MAGFRKDTLALIDESRDILQEMAPMSLRGLFYQLVSRGFFENKRTNYQKLSRTMTTARERGLIRWTWIVDNLRATLKPSSWSGLGHFAESVRDCYRKDFWTRQEHYVEIFCEKDAMAGVIQPITRKYDVALNVIRGYCSATFAHSIASQWRQIEKPVFAYYLGDFDPSGMDVERALEQKLSSYSKRLSEYRDDADEDSYTWTRLAVVPNDFDDFDLIPIMAKKTDSRTKAFEERYGHKCAELDAVPADVLRRRVEEAILSHVNMSEWERMQEIEDAETDELGTLVDNLQAAG